MTVLSPCSHIANAATIERPFMWSTDRSCLRVADQGPNYLALPVMKPGRGITARA